MNLKPLIYPINLKCNFSIDHTNIAKGLAVHLWFIIIYIFLKIRIESMNSV